LGDERVNDLAQDVIGHGFRIYKDGPTISELVKSFAGGVEDGGFGVAISHDPVIIALSMAEMRPHINEVTLRKRGRVGSLDWSPVALILQMGVEPSLEITRP